MYLTDTKLPTLAEVVELLQKVTPQTIEDAITTLSDLPLDLPRAITVLAEISNDCRFFALIHQYNPDLEINTKDLKWKIDALDYVQNNLFPLSFHWTREAMEDRLEEGGYGELSVPYFIPIEATGFPGIYADETYLEMFESYQFLWVLRCLTVLNEEFDINHFKPLVDVSGFIIPDEGEDRYLTRFFKQCNAHPWPWSEIEVLSGFVTQNTGNPFIDFSVEWGDETDETTIPWEPEEIEYLMLEWDKRNKLIDRLLAVEEWFRDHPENYRKLVLLWSTCYSENPDQLLLFEQGTSPLFLAA